MHATNEPSTDPRAASPSTTHQVTNQAPELLDYNLFDSDPDQNA